jgi:glycosyltransferase involved in cell wall biosynthesis
MEKVTVGYTIFNKEKLIPEIMNGIITGFEDTDEIIFVFDNCSDNSYKLVKNAGMKAQLITSKVDLFEIKANNLILDQAKNDIVILFQDDIINHDNQIKKKIFKVLHDIRKQGKIPGLLGGRSGFELTGNPTFPFETKMRASNWEHLDSQYSYRLEPWEYLERTILNRGPIVFTRDQIRKGFTLDEIFYPLWGDDTDYCCKAKFEEGRTNAVFECNVVSSLDWGATRKRKVYPTIDGTPIKLNTLYKRNWKIIMDRWGKDLKKHYENLAVNV